MAGGTEFLIEIEQRMSGANVASELDRVGASVKSAIDRYKELERAGAQSAKGLEKVGAEMAKTRAAMKAAMDKGDDKGAAKAAESLRKLVDKEQELKTQATATSAALKTQAATVTQLAGAFEKLKGKQDEAAKAAAKIPIDAAKAGDGLGKLGGPLGSVGQRGKDMIEGVRDLVGQLGPLGAAAAIGAVAIVALTAAFVVGVVALGKYALGLADVKRGALLTAEAFAGSASGGAALVQTYGEVSKSTGVASDRLHEISKELKKAGVDAKDFPAALKAIALQEKALGDTSGTAGLIEDLKAGKKSAAAMADEMSKKFGGVVAKKMLGLSEQGDTLQRNLAGVFGGLNIEPFLAGMAKLVGLFDSSTESGRAMKVLFESVFQPLIDAIPFAAIERFFLQMVIGGLKVGIAIKRISKEFDDIDTSGLDGWGETASGVATATYELADALGIVSAASASMTGAFQAVKWGLSALGAVIGNVKRDIDTLVTIVRGAASGLSDIGSQFETVGANIINGIVAGIKAGASKVVSSITDVASSAVSAAKEALDIASPSRVFEKIGGYIPAGMVQGIDGGVDDVGRSLDSMVEAPEPSGFATRGGGAKITIEQLIINGVEGAADVPRLLADQLADLLDGISIQTGAEAT